MFNETNQVGDDIELLKLMLADRNKAQLIYQPTNYWRNYENLLLDELYNQGLHNFRQRKNSVLSSFSATDLTPLSNQVHHLSVWGKRPLWKSLLPLFMKIKTLKRLLNSQILSGISLTNFRKIIFEYTKLYGQKTNAKSIEELKISTYGNPEDLFKIGDNLYTTSMLNYYLQYSYCCNYIDFNNIRSILELGCGSGKQVEILKKFYPQLTFYLFDMPPQLYVCEQYLSKVFPDKVISYRTTRNMNRIPENDDNNIYIFANWRISEIENINIDLFWNAASFQEMEPNVVENYLQNINRITKCACYLCEQMYGAKLASGYNKHGVIKQTTLNHYINGLKDFSLLNISPAIYFPIIDPEYYFSYWGHK